MEIVVIGVEILRRAFCRCGPYLFVELLMPGGTLLALLMYLYQRQAAKKRLRNPVESTCGRTTIRDTAPRGRGAEPITFKEIRRCASW